MADLLTMSQLCVKYGPFDCRSLNMSTAREGGDATRGDLPPLMIVFLDSVLLLWLSIFFLNEWWPRCSQTSSQ